jgi:hypothetical protein
MPDHTNLKNRRPNFNTAKLGLGIVLMALSLIFGAVACGADDVSGTSGGSCSADTDCPIGSVCSVNGSCVESPCQYCLDDQICYRTADNPEGTCSAPECVDESDCNGQPCIEGQCGGPPGSNGGGDDSCENDTDCPTGYSCHPLSDTCVEDENAGEDPCDNVTCDVGQTCNPNTGECVDDNGGGSCDKEPSDCTGATPALDEASCECVECASASDCSGGLTCQNNSCVDSSECATECEPGTPGMCGGNTPYCVNECCSECIGGGDCAGSQLCIDGFCQDPSGCSSPADCPTGYDCQGGQCVPPSTGQDCSDVDDCPDGTICNPDTGQCEELGGDLGCGFCNPDCTCPGDLTCDGGFVCYGCRGFAGDCPDGQFCMANLEDPFSPTGTCLPNFFE